MKQEEEHGTAEVLEDKMRNIVLLSIFGKEERRGKYYADALAMNQEEECLAAPALLNKGNRGV